MRLCQLRMTMILAAVALPTTHLCATRTAEAQVSPVYWATPSPLPATGNWHDAYNPGVNTGWQSANGIDPAVIPNYAGAIAIRSSNAASSVTVNSPATVGSIITEGGATNPFTVLPTSPLTLDQDGAGSGAATVTLSRTGTGARLIFGDTTTPGTIVLADNALFQYTGRTSGATSAQDNGAIQILSTIDGIGDLTLSSTHAVGTPTETVFRGAIRLQNGTTPNTFQGSVSIPKGLVAFNGQSFGNVANVITLGAAGADSAMMIATADTASVPNKVVVAASNTGTLALGSTANATYTPFSGEIVLDSSAELRVATGTASSVQTFSGVISGAGGLTKTGSTGATAVLSANNSYSGLTNVNFGTLLVNGTHTGGGNYSVAANATLGGNGSIGSNVNLQSAAHLSPGTSVGKLTIGGDVTSTDLVYDWQLGALATDMPGTNFDQTVVGTDLSLGGTATIALDFSLLAPELQPAGGNAFWNASHSWKVIDTATNIGSTNFTTLAGNSGPGTWSVDLNAGDVILKYTVAATLTGDVNSDNIVNQLDLNVVFGNWLSTGATLAQGDANNDGVINQLDINTITGNWLATGPAGGLSSTSVPEPSSCALGLLAALGLAIARKRRMQCPNPLSLASKPSI